MKKIVWSIGLCMLLFQSQAQESSKLNILLGPNIGNYTGGSVDRKSSIGFQGGLQYSHPLANQLTINPAVLFTRTSFKSDIFDEEDNAKSTSYYSNFIQQQTYLQKHLPSRVYLGVGYVFSYLMSATYKPEGGKMTDAYLGSSKRIDLGLGLQVGYAFTNRISTDFSFEHGLIDQNKSGTESNRIWILKLNLKYALWTK